MVIWILLFRTEAPEPLPKWSEALMLWLSWNSTYEKLTQQMFKGSERTDRLEAMMDELDQLRTRAVALSDGKIRWSRDTIKDNGGKTVDYGMASSPLLAGDLVIVTPGAPNATLAAYHSAEYNNVVAVQDYVHHYFE